MTDKITLLAVSDVVVTRKRDPESTFKHVAPLLREADITFFNNEAAYASVGSPHAYGATPHDPSCMPALSYAGFDVCAFANNHTLAWGVDALLECLQRLKDMNIAVCGAGANIDEARAPAFLERKGLRFAFLGYNCVGPNGYMAETDKPGCAMVRIHTHYEPYEWQPGTPAQIVTFAYRDDLKAMVEDVQRAKEAADMVFVSFHWGIHNVRAVIPDYAFEVGHAALDAGADAILGHHPHVLKGVEVYKGKAVFHSLGNNFAMGPAQPPPEGEVARGRIPRSFHDLMLKLYGGPSPDNRKSMVAKFVISGKGEIERVSYLPAFLGETGEPELLPASDPRSDEVVRYISDISDEAELGTRFERDGDEVVVVREPGR